jgi:hypothetical protein
MPNRAAAAVRLVPDAPGSSGEATPLTTKTIATALTVPASSFVASSRHFPGMVVSSEFEGTLHPLLFNTC